LDDNWSLSEAAQRLGSGALFLGLTHGLFGQTPLKMYSEDKDIPSPQDQQTFNLLEDHLAPETKGAMAEASVARATAGKPFDPINDLVGLDPRIVAHEAKLSQIAGSPVTLPLEERAKVLASMDDGTYKEPMAPTAAEPEVTPPSDTKVTLPNQSKGQAGFLNIEPIANAITKMRLAVLTDKLTTETTTQPKPLSTEPLTDPEKNVTTLLQPYERTTTGTKEATKPAVQAGSSSGAVGRAGSPNPESKALGASNKWGGLSGIRTGGESLLTQGGRIRFRNGETYRHGAISYLHGASKPFVITAARKGTFTPDTLHQHGSLGEALDWLKGGGYNQFRQIQGPKQPEPKIVPTPKMYEIKEHEAPDVPTPVLRQAEEAQISRQRAINGLRKYNLQLWSKDGGWYPHGVQTLDGKQTFEYGTPKFDQIYEKARELVESFIHKFRAFHDEQMLGELMQNDFTRVAEMPHQLPKPLDQLEGYRLFTLHNKNADAEPTSSWSNDKTLEAHVATSILRDKEGKPHLVVHEAQGGYSKNISAEKGMGFLANRVRDYANEHGLPVVLPSTKTALALYGRNEINPTFTRAYSKGGYVRAGFNKAFGIRPNRLPPSPIELEKMWNPMMDKAENFKGLTIPDNTNEVKPASEIIKEENMKEPGYNQAVRCVTGTI